MAENIDNDDASIEERSKAYKTNKMIVLVIVAMFVLPYIPLRKGRLIDQYGYVNALLFEAAVFITIIPLVVIFTLRNMEQEISQLEIDLEHKKRLEKLNEKEL